MTTLAVPRLYSRRWLPLHVAATWICGFVFLVPTSLSGGADIELIFIDTTQIFSIPNIINNCLHVNCLLKIAVWGQFGLDLSVGSCTIILDSQGRSSKEFLFVFAFLSPCLAIIVCYARWDEQHSELRSMMEYCISPGSSSLPTKPPRSRLRRRRLRSLTRMQNYYR